MALNLGFIYAVIVFYGKHLANWTEGKLTDLCFAKTQANHKNNKFGCLLAALRMGIF